jgi:hypothetical protein
MSSRISRPIKYVNGKPLIKRIRIHKCGPDQDRWAGYPSKDEIINWNEASEYTDERPEEMKFSEMSQTELLQAYEQAELDDDIGSAIAIMGEYESREFDD